MYQWPWCHYISNRRTGAVLCITFPDAVDLYYLLKENDIARTLHCGDVHFSMEGESYSKARAEEDDATALFGSVPINQKFQATNHHLPEGQRHYLLGGHDR